MQTAVGQSCQLHETRVAPHSSLAWTYSAYSYTQFHGCKKYGSCNTVLHNLALTRTAPAPRRERNGWRKSQYGQNQPSHGYRNDSTCGHNFVATTRTRENSLGGFDYGSLSVIIVLSSKIVLIPCGTYDPAIGAHQEGGGEIMLRPLLGRPHYTPHPPLSNELVVSSSANPRTRGPNRTPRINTRNL